MPELELGNTASDWEVWIGLKIRSVMVHPNNELFQQEFLAWAIISNLYVIRKGDEGDQFKPSINEIEKGFKECGGYETLIKSPSCKDVFERAIKSATKACIAGEILYEIIKRNQDGNGGKYFGVNQAASQLARDIPVSFAIADGIKPPGVRTLMKYWAEFKNVAHLWAALHCYLGPIPVGNKILGCGTKFYFSNPEIATIQRKTGFKFPKINSGLKSSKWKNTGPRDPMYYMETLHEFLAVSEKIKKIAHSIKWHKKEPPVLREDCWSVPKSLSLPKVDIDWPRV
ncbi:MAG: hypothetical protein IH886_16195 [Nitrospinae bacterium]|nr:hypothetical protein [Nitrospinota bacterium]